jgi:hypothetical protein
MVRQEFIETLRQLRDRAAADGDDAAVAALVAAIRRMHGSAHAKPVEVALRGCSAIAPGTVGCVMARRGGEPWHPVHVDLVDRERWEIVSFYVGDELQPVAHIFDGDDFRMAESGWDVVLQVINRGTDAAVIEGRMHGYAATASDRLRAVTRDMDREAALLEEAADVVLLGDARETA